MIPTMAKPSAPADRSRREKRSRRASRHERARSRRSGTPSPSGDDRWLQSRQNRLVEATEIRPRWERSESVFVGLISAGFTAFGLANGRDLGSALVFIVSTVPVLVGLLVLIYRQRFIVEDDHYGVKFGPVTRWRDRAELRGIDLTPLELRIWGKGRRPVLLRRALWTDERLAEVAEALDQTVRTYPQRGQWFRGYPRPDFD